MNAWDDMRAAINAAKETQSAADASADAMADILIGRLRHLAPWRAKLLKAELQDFNARTELWKVPKL